MSIDPNLTCWMALGCYTVPLASGVLLATIGKTKGWKKRGLFWLGLIGSVIVAGLLIFLLIVLSDTYHGDAPAWVGNVVLGVIILLSALSPLMFITAIFLRIKYRGRFVAAPVDKFGSLPGSAEPQVLQPPQAILEPGEKKVDAAFELITVPEGVTIHVKRSRTIQHTISVNWTVSGNISGSASLVKLIDLSIQSAIERSKETSYEESETIEYGVDLNGAVSHAFKLVWTDVWRQGKVDLETNIGRHSIPFEYREHSELKVIPVKDE